MKVFYQSALINKELSPNGVFFAIPEEASLFIQRERDDDDYIILLNGKIIDSDIDSIPIYAEADLLIRFDNYKIHYSVKPIVKPLSGKDAMAYRQFHDSYEQQTDNLIDSICSADLKLYAVDQINKVEDLTEIFSKIENAYGKIKLICQKPKSHLRAVNEVRPIETVKRIGYESIPYLSAHSEDWLARTVGGLKPARLFSRVEDDDYQIYENRVVKTLIDEILSFLQKKEDEYENLRNQLTSIMNSGVQLNSFGFDALFQKAVSELLSFSDSNKDRSNDVKLVEDLIKMCEKNIKRYRTLKQSKLYRYLKKSKKVIPPLLDTNILLMDKKYNAVYKLWKDIHEIIAPVSDTEEATKLASFKQDDYLSFCQTLIEYTAHILNFERIGEGKYFRENDALQFTIKESSGVLHVLLEDKTKRQMVITSGLQVPLSNGEHFEDFSFIDGILYWDNAIDNAAIDRFCSKFKSRESRGKEQADEKKRYLTLKQALDQKQREYGIRTSNEVFIYPAFVKLEKDTKVLFKRTIQECINQNHNYNLAKYFVVALPKCDEDEQDITNYAKYSDDQLMFLPLTLFDINSFRRIQSVLMRQILSVSNHTHCPLCGQEMRVVDNHHICDHCNSLVLTKTTCPEPNCKKEYYYFSYNISPDTIIEMEGKSKDIKHSFYEMDSLFQYKDIVPMSVEEGKIRTTCPFCGK